MDLFLWSYFKGGRQEKEGGKTLWICAHPPEKFPSYATGERNDQLCKTESCFTVARRAGSVVAAGR